MSTQFRVLVPVQHLDRAMPRSGLGPDEQRQLAQAFAGDTLRALGASRAVAEVVVVSPDDRVAELAAHANAAFVLVGPNLGINASLNYAHSMSSLLPMTVAVVGDLPALERQELDVVLSEIGRSRRPAYATDLRGTGVTLHAAPTRNFEACLEDDSVHRLNGSAARVGRLAMGLRCDVDTCMSLRIAEYAGLGQQTANVVHRMRDRIRRVADAA
jgi:2-phospho-L-lactate guanylyltransferase